MEEATPSEALPFEEFRHFPSTQTLVVEPTYWGNVEMNLHQGPNAYAASMLDEQEVSALHDRALPFSWRVFLEALQIRSRIRRTNHRRALHSEGRADDTD